MISRACPRCGRANDVHASVEELGKMPNTGDVSLCWGCKQPSIFTVIDGYTYLRRPNADEQAELDADPQVQAALAVFREQEHVGTTWDAVRKAMGYE